MVVYQDDSLTLHTDLYQINMMKTYWEQGIQNKKAIFEAYFRKLPFENGYAIFVGLERIVHYLQQLRFTDSDIDYLRELGEYPEEYLTYLKEFRFEGTIRSAVEGELVFANEPLVQVEGSLAECQLIETALLNIINYQTLVATKAARVHSVAGRDPVLEFGTRRAQEMDAALWGTRAAYIAGCVGTSNVRAGKIFGIPVFGTHAHALVQAYRDDYEAFKAYASTHKDCVFLVDTYDTLKSGVPNAIRVANEFGDRINFKGVRIDSGDMAYISKKVRQQLDEAGYFDAKIYASNDLDERTILNLKMQGAKIDIWGVGTKLITAYDQPALGCVYKLVSIEDENGNMVDTMKISNNVEKVSTPGKKQVWRITRNSNGKSEGDYITQWDERPDLLEELFMFHPVHTYINKTVTDFTARPVLQTIFEKGKLVYQLPTLEEVRDYAMFQLNELWEEYKRILNPEPYPVDLSQKLYAQKIKSIKAIRQEVKEKASKLQSQ